MTAAGAASIPPIEPVDGTAPRPRWSVMIPAYDCAPLLEHTLVSVLEQAPGPEAMQIEVVDDASHDDPGRIVERVGRGRVGYLRQPRNLGVPEILTDCIRRSRGEIVHLLHGDDAVRPGFYAALERAFAADPRLGAAFCRHVYMDAYGHWQGIGPLLRSTSGILEDGAECLASEQRIMTPSICVRRAVYERLGGFHPSLRCAEDWEMWVRIAASYPVWYETEPLALYRMHDASNTGRHHGTADDIAYTASAIELLVGHLPEERRESLARRARTGYALSALESAGRAYVCGDTATARARCRGAFALSRAPRVWLHAARTLLRALARRAGLVAER